MVEIQITQGQIVLVDDCDADLSEHAWSAVKYKTTKGFYVTRHEGKRPFRTIVHMHRIIMERVLGRPLTKDEEVDHIHHNGLDNRRSEIRLATKQQNMQNRRIGSNNTSGYKGVSIEKRSGKFKAQIWEAGSNTCLGRFDTAEEAALAYNLKATELFGEFALLNEV